MRKGAVKKAVRRDVVQKAVRRAVVKKAPCAGRRRPPSRRAQEIGVGNASRILGHAAILIVLRILRYQLIRRGCRRCGLA